MAIDINKHRHRKPQIQLPFGMYAANARINQGITQETLGYRVGFSQSIISRQETGRLEYAPRDAAAVAMALGNRRLLERYCDTCPVSKAYQRMSKPRPA